MEPENISGILARLGIESTGPPTGEPPQKDSNYLDIIIRFFPNTKDRILEICAPLYEEWPFFAVRRLGIFHIN
jgi:hypothetical protein